MSQMVTLSKYAFKTGHGYSGPVELGWVAQKKTNHPAERRQWSSKKDRH